MITENGWKRDANSTIERDIIRQDFLESRGWAVERIWSRNWWQNSDREITRLQQKIACLYSIGYQRRFFFMEVNATETFMIFVLM